MDPETQPTEPQPTEPQGEPNGEPGAGEGEGQGDPEALQDAGKKALDSMKGKWHSERERRKALEAEIESLRAANAPKGEGDQPDAEAIRREAAQTAVKAANERILKAEVRVAAAGKLADPADALRMLDISQFEVDADGNVDAEEIAGAIDDLLVSKPYLSAQGTRRFQGTADGGARKGNREGAQVTRDELKSMSPDAIIKAQKEGRLSDLGYK